MLIVHSVSKRYGRAKVLEKASFSLEPGSLNVMIGPNGAGKSTLLRILAGMERPDEGGVVLEGAQLREEDFVYLPQDLSFHPLLTVSRVIRFYAEVWHRPAEVAEAALRRWGLEAHRGKRTSQLSGGLRQRLGLAVLSMRSTRLILLDEPGLSLDPEWRRTLTDWLIERRAEGATALVTTHIGHEWTAAADRVLRCRGGIVEDLKAAAEEVSGLFMEVAR